MTRRKKEHKRPGKRHKLLLDVHLETWLDFQRWCGLNGKIASEEIEDFMAQTVATADPLLDQPNTEP